MHMTDLPKAESQPMHSFPATTLNQYSNNRNNKHRPQSINQSNQEGSNACKSCAGVGGMTTNICVRKQNALYSQHISGYILSQQK